MVDDAESPDEGGRPKAFIDWGFVDRLLEAGASGQEVAAYFGIHPNTLYEQTKKIKNLSFSEYSQAKKSRGDSLIRLQQYEDARGISTNKGNTQLLLRLGEVRLGQRKDISEDDLDEVLSAIKGANEHARNAAPSEPRVAAESPVLHKEQRREAHSVSAELGAEDTSFGLPPV